MSETAVEESIQEPWHVIFRRWLTSAAGITILLTVAVAVWAVIDAGPFILVNTIVTGGM